MSHRSLLDHFSALSDPRQRGKVVYPLPEIMLLVLCATLAGAEDFVEIRHWGRQKLDFLRSLLPFAQGIRKPAVRAVLSGFLLMGYRVSLWTHTKTPPAFKFCRFRIPVAAVAGRMTRSFGSLRKANVTA